MALVSKGVGKELAQFAKANDSNLEHGWNWVTNLGF